MLLIGILMIMPPSISFTTYGMCYEFKLYPNLYLMVFLAKDYGMLLLLPIMTGVSIVVSLSIYVLMPSVPFLDNCEL